MKLSAAAAHIKSLSSSDLFPRRSVAKTDGCASSVNAVMLTPCCDGSMSVDSCRSDATEAITMMEVDPLRRRRDEDDMSLDSSTDDERFRREVCADGAGAKDGDSVGDVSMGETVKGSIGSSGGLNGPYWVDFVLEAARCVDVLGVDINMPYRRFTRSRMKMASRSENSCVASSTEGTQDVIPMDLGCDDDEDVLMEDVDETRRIVEDDEEEEGEEEEEEEDDDNESLMSVLRTDGDGDWAFEGLDVQAINACTDRFGEMNIGEWTRMEVDDDDGSIAIARYHIKSTEVLDQHKSRVYFTRGLARLLLKRTRSGLCY